MRGMAGYRLFVERLWHMVNDDRSNVVQWSNDGSKILVNQTNFENEMSTSYHHLNKSSKLISFKRRLNAHGFRTIKLKPQKDKVRITALMHPYFQRYRPDLLQYVIHQDKARPRDDINNLLPNHDIWNNEETTRKSTARHCKCKAKPMDNKLKTMGAVVLRAGSAEKTQQDEKQSRPIVLLPFILWKNRYVPLSRAHRTSTSTTLGSTSSTEISNKPVRVDEDDVNTPTWFDRRCCPSEAGHSPRQITSSSAIRLVGTMKQETMYNEASIRNKEPTQTEDSANKELQYDVTMEDVTAAGVVIKDEPRSPEVVPPAESDWLQLYGSDSLTDQSRMLDVASDIPDICLSPDGTELTY